MAATYRPIQHQPTTMVECVCALAVALLALSATGFAPAPIEAPPDQTRTATFAVG